MTITKIIVATAVAGVLGGAAWIYVASTPSGDTHQLTAAEQALVDEHVYGGLPSNDSLYIRNGYILCYNAETRTPRWVAYHVKPSYRQTPERDKEFKAFNDDPDIEGEAHDADYDGLFTQRGYARGHLAPFAVMGGDRDGDGKLADLDPTKNDPDDALTVFQANYMSNIAPQHHNAFNGSGGLWGKLERWIQDKLVTEQGKEVWVFAGCIFGPGDQEKVGDPTRLVTVPPMFYKIVVLTNSQAPQKPIVLAFLFPHQRAAHGDKTDFLVTVDVIEALTGLDFFSELSEADQKTLEDQDTWEVWEEYFQN